MRKARPAFHLALWLLVLPAGLVAADPLRVVALGDSLTAGYGLRAEEGIVPQLDRWLERNGAGEVELVNAGVSGDTTRGGLARLDWTLSEGADAMIVTLGGNDLLRGVDPASSRANLAAILEGAAARDIDVLLVGLRAGQNYGEGYKRAFDTIYPDLAADFGTLYFEDFFAGLGGYGSPESRRPWFQGDGLHPNAEGVARIVEALGPKVLELIEAARADSEAGALAEEG